MNKSFFFLLCIFSTTNLIAQKRSEPRKTEYEQHVIDLSKNKLVKDAFAIIDQLEPITRKEHIELTQIPAPPFKEEKRAQQFKQMLEAAKADKVWIDSLGNVLALRKGTKGTRTVVLDAHLDTVFPEGTDVTVKQIGDTLFAPGIADDTRGLIAILTVLRAMEKSNLRTTNDVLFVATLGEEGLGDLRGAKYVVEKSKLKIDSWIAVDGTDIDFILNGALAACNFFKSSPDKLGFVSTNANTPIAHGIPAICIGAGGKSEHEHSLDEWWINTKGADGIKFVLLTLMMEAGIGK